MYLDTRCYDCVIIALVSPTEHDNFATYDYEGKGMFKCPRCGHIWDLSKSTYDVRLKITKHGETDDEWLEIDVVEPYDPRILVKPKGELSIKEQMEDDLVEYQEEYWDGSHGMFDVELYFQWSSSGYYTVEWDLEIEVLKKTVVEVQSSTPKVIK